MRSDDNGGTQSATILFRGYAREFHFYLGVPEYQKFENPCPLKYQIVLDLVLCVFRLDLIILLKVDQNTTLLHFFSLFFSRL